MRSISQALLTNPDVLILNEATEGLAPLIAKEIWRTCCEIKQSGISSIIVDKNRKHVTQNTDNNVILVKGEVVFSSSSAELIAKPEVLEQHLSVWYAVYKRNQPAAVIDTAQSAIEFIALNSLLIQILY